MGEILSVILDLVMIGLLLTGIAYAVKLHKQLAALRASRADMERFVAEFSVTVQRAEAGVKGLKLAAREGGDDLEKQIDKAQQIRDELHFLVDSADKIASRLSDTAAFAARSVSSEARAAPVEPPKTAPAAKAPPAQPGAKKPEPAPQQAAAHPSNAEAELLQALEKLG